jgi:hypothetical protein
MFKLKVFAVISTVLIVLVMVIAITGLVQNSNKYAHLEKMRAIECQTK